MTLSPNMFTSLLVIILLIILLPIAGRKVEKMDPGQPIKGPIFLVIMMIDGLNSFIRQFYGRHWKTFSPILITVLLYLALANTSALFGLNNPLANINIALGFSILAFLIVQISGLIVRTPIKRIKDLMSPSPFLFPLNLISEISTTTAMGLRLFGNLLSGSVVTVLFLGLLPGFVSVIPLTFVAHPIFNIGFGLIQAFVYFMLLTVFVSMAIQTEDA